MRAHFTIQDYQAIVNKIYGEISDESAESVIEFENGDCLLVVGFSHVGPLLHFDGFARLDEQQAHRDKCHFFGGLGHS